MGDTPEWTVLGARSRFGGPQKASIYFTLPVAIFDTLWSKHRALQDPPMIEPCQTNGVSNFQNQCAIRLGVALTLSGINLASFHGTTCWHGHGRMHPLKVEQLKLWINSDDATFAPSYAEKSKRDGQGRQKSHHAFIGKQGIVAFLNFWGPGNAGDHIDLWNGNRIAHGDNSYFAASQELWFWPLP
jgi:hypothetical protein